MKEELGEGTWKNRDYSGEDYELVHLSEVEELTIRFHGEGRENTHEEHGRYVAFRGVSSDGEKVRFNTQSSRLLGKLQAVDERVGALTGVKVRIEREKTGPSDYDVIYHVEVVEIPDALYGSEVEEAEEDLS